MRTRTKLISLITAGVAAAAVLAVVPATTAHAGFPCFGEDVVRCIPMPTERNNTHIYADVWIDDGPSTDHDVAVSNVRLQAYYGEQYGWRTIASTVNDDYDGWFDTRDGANSRWLDCHPGYYRAAATYKWRHAGGGTITEEHLYSLYDWYNCM